MPFIEENKLASLYKEIDQEKKAAIFFQNLHLENKAKLARFTVFRLGFFVCLGLFFLSLVYFLSIDISKDSEKLYQKIEQLSLENKLLGGGGKDVQNILREVKVYSVQFMASTNKDVLLFSDNFVNFRAHPLQGFNAYSLGNFSTKEEAEAFRQELLKLGLKDVWVTSFQSGERILLND